MKTTWAIVFAWALACAVQAENESIDRNQAKERLRELQLFFAENGLEERPVTTIKKNVPISRGFNRTLSGAAYAQLHGAPQLDANSSEKLEKVAQFYLDSPEHLGSGNSAYWAAEFYAGSLALFGKYGTQRPGAISQEKELVMLEYMFAFVDKWSELKRYELSTRFHTLYYWSTENHWWQRVCCSWGFLVTLRKEPEYANRKLRDGKTVEEHYQVTNEYIRMCMQQKVRKGFLQEISSGSYGMRMMSMWMMIYQIAPEEHMKQLARNTLDLWWTFWAEEHVSGERGGGKVRHRGKGIRGFDSSLTGTVGLFMGLGPNDAEWFREAIKRPEIVVKHFASLYSGYVPHEIVYRILEDRKMASPREHSMTLNRGIVSSTPR